MSFRRHASLGLALIAGTLVLLEVGARVALGAMGPGPAPLQLQWNEGEGQGKRDQLRDMLYRPDPHTFFRLLPDLELETTPVDSVFDVRTGPHGLRGAGVRKEKPTGTLRVLCLGDSCTFGTGVGTDDTFPERLQDRLREARPGENWEVLNAGVPGFSSYQARRFLEVDGWDFAPDVVVFSLGYNDTSAAVGGRKRQIAAGVQLSDKEYGARTEPPSPLAIVRLVQRLRPTAVPEADPSAPEQEASQPKAKARRGQRGKRNVKLRVSAQEYRENLEAIADQCKARGVRLVLVAWALKSQALEALDPSRRMKACAEFRGVIRVFAQERGLPLLDLVPGVKGRQKLFIDRVHMNAEGYDFVAERLLEVLEGALAVSPPR
jgi:lysophospholipase L1-like esterase